MVKKNTDHYLSIYAYIFFLQNGYYIKIGFFTKITGIFCYRREETSFHCEENVCIIIIFGCFELKSCTSSPTLKNMPQNYRCYTPDIINQAL